MKNRKITKVVVFIAVAAMVLAGCNNTNAPTASPKLTATATLLPTPTLEPVVSPQKTPDGTDIIPPSISPLVTATPNGSASPLPSGTNVQGAYNPTVSVTVGNAQKISDELVKITDVFKAVVVINGNECLIGLETGNTKLNDALKGQVEDAVATVDNGIVHCIVTTDAELTGKIRTLAGNVKAGKSTTSLTGEYNDITAKITG